MLCHSGEVNIAASLAPLVAEGVRLSRAVIEAEVARGDPLLEDVVVEAIVVIIVVVVVVVVVIIVIVKQFGIKNGLQEDQNNNCRKNTKEVEKINISMK